MTTLTQAQVEQGIAFKAACSLLKNKYLSKERIWASYGDYDRRQVERQCQSLQVSYPFDTRHINVKSLFAIIHALPQEVGMDKALELLKLLCNKVYRIEYFLLFCKFRNLEIT